MSVYVDDMRRKARVGRIKGVWSHLMADSHEELQTFARVLELRPEWIQHPGTHREHYDVTEAVRADAIRRGAIRINYPRGTGVLLSEKRAAQHRPNETEGEVA